MSHMAYRKHNMSPLYPIFVGREEDPNLDGVRSLKTNVPPADTRLHIFH